MIRLIGRSLSVFLAIAIGAAIAFACFAPEDAIHRARAYVPISVSFPAKVAACEEKPAAQPPMGKIEFVENYVTGADPATKIMRVALTGIFREPHERQMVEVLDRAKRDGVTDVELLIDSPGGNIETGFHLAALLAESPFAVHCLAGRQTASSAFVVLQGCDDRAALPSSMLMEHRPYLNLMAPMRIQAETLREYGDSLLELRHMMIELLAVKSAETLGVANGLTMDEIEKRLAEDWTMTSAEAVGFGFIDRVTPSIDAFQESIEGDASAATK